jgi:hypothetical protein
MTKLEVHSLLTPSYFYRISRLLSWWQIERKCLARFHSIFWLNSIFLSLFHKVTLWSPVYILCRKWWRPWTLEVAALGDVQDLLFTSSHMWLCSCALHVQWHPSSSTEEQLDIVPVHPTFGLVFLFGSFLAYLLVEFPCGVYFWYIVTPNQIGCVAVNQSESVIPQFM